MADLKWCGACFTHKPPDQFHRNRAKSDGFQVCCKSCAKRSSHEHYVKHKAEYLARAREQKRRIKALVREAKLHPCVDCGRTFDPRIMDLDHVRGKKSFELFRATGFGILQVKEEIAKTSPRCSNCHRARTFGILQREGDLKASSR